MPFQPGKSGNPDGRPTKTRQRKVKKKNLESQLAKDGPAALRRIMTLARQLEKDGDTINAIKTYQFIAKEYYDFIIHEDNIEIKRKYSGIDKKEKEEDEKSKQSAGPSVVFMTSAKKEENN